MTARTLRSFRETPLHWMWIDRILDLEPGRRIVAIKHVSLAEEHLRDHFGPTLARPGRAARPPMPLMPASLIIEGVAQSGGILVGHAGGFRDNIVLAKIPRAELDADAAPGDTLRYDITIERADRQGSAVAALVDRAPAGGDFVRIGRVELIFSVLDAAAPASSGIPIPAGSFVFGESFRTLLRASSIDPAPCPSLPTGALSGP